MMDSFQLRCGPHPITAQARVSRHLIPPYENKARATYSMKQALMRLATYRQRHDASSQDWHLRGVEPRRRDVVSTRHVSFSIYRRRIGYPVFQNRRGVVWDSENPNADSCGVLPSLAGSLSKLVCALQSAPSELAYLNHSFLVVRSHNSTARHSWSFVHTSKFCRRI